MEDAWALPEALEGTAGEVLMATVPQANALAVGSPCVAAEGD